MSQSTRPFRVIIIGAGVSGLTLALMLERAGIDFLVLERGNESSILRGASIGLQANTLRILDQLQIYQDIAEKGTPLETIHQRLANGVLFRKSESASELTRRHGYPTIIIERGELLQVLYDKLQHKAKVQYSQKVIDIQSCQENATVITDTAQRFEGDLIAGADGIRSFTRHKIWQRLAESNPDLLVKESQRMKCEYACIFGISYFPHNDPELIPGSMHIIQGNNVSTSCVVGNHNKLFWTICIHVDQKTTLSNIPRYDEKDLETALIAYKTLNITKNTQLENLSDIASTRVMVPLEEADFRQWYHERLTILGDAAHKFTPNAGQGGNAAIESAAVLVNLLRDRLKSSAPSGRVSGQDIQGVLKAYQSLRQKRVADMYTMSYAVVRLQAMRNYFWELLAMNLLPLMGEEFEISAMSEMLLGAPSLDFLNHQDCNAGIPWSGWSPRTMVCTAIKQLPVAHQMESLATLVIACLTMIYCAHFLGLLSMPKNNHAAECLIANRCHKNLVELTHRYLGIFSWGTIGAIELFRVRNIQFLPSIPFIILCLYSFSLRQFVSSLAVAAVLGLSCVSDYRGYAHTLTKSNARLIVYMLLSSIALLMIRLIINRLSWRPKAVEDIFVLLLLLPTWTLYLFAISRKENALTMVGHEDLSTVREAYLISFLLSTVSHFTRICALWKYTVAIPRMAIVLEVLAVITLYLKCLYKVPYQNRTWKLLVKSSVLVGALTIGFGPGGAASLIWCWREDRVRCSEHRFLRENTNAGQIGHK